MRYQTLPNPAIPTLAGDPPGEWISAGLFNSARSMIVAGLTSGQRYNFHVRAIGSSTGQSDWSDPVSHMSL